MTVEVERFIADARRDAGMAAEAVAKGGDRGTLIAFANARGYKISDADINTYLAAHQHELSDGQLNQIAAAKIGGSDVPDNMLSLLTALRANTGPIPS